MKKKNLKNLVLRKQSVSNLNKTLGGNASIDVGTIIDTIIDITTKYTRVFSYCPHVSCNDCPPQLTEFGTCVRTLCDDLTCNTCV
ncbi:hypothetical protein [uncultured Kordia sp.]|uniref:hypothetical protein n=1 Tax=uncultured Kordia sp. TaxID=507699 RepID=UPI002603F8D6|nr:hypothetical protein [uncultured Kordia sp.]